MDTKKALGQHWLKDISVLNAIADAAAIVAGDTVLEIGPGLGTLTQILADRQAIVRALEFDSDLVPGLISSFSNTSLVKIEQGDIRTFDFRSMPLDYKIVANIPYYLTSNLIRLIADTERKPSLAALLIQQEVAQRLCAMPGQMGILSLIAQFYYEVSLDIEVPARYFTPPPKVDSQVVVLRRRAQLPFQVDTKKFFRLVKAGFSEKRKVLRNSLSGGLSIEKSEAERLLLAAGIAPDARAQELGLPEWYALYLHYAA